MFQVCNFSRFSELAALFNLTSHSMLISMGGLIRCLTVRVFCFHRSSTSRKSNLLLCVILSGHHALPDYYDVMKAISTSVFLVFYMCS